MLTNHYYTLRKLQYAGIQSSNEDLRPEDFNVQIVGSGWRGSSQSIEYRIEPLEPEYASLLEYMKSAVCHEQYNYGYSVFGTTRDRCGVYFGSGSTPATQDDYRLESPIESGLTFTNGTIRKNTQADGSTIYRNSYIVVNSSDADIVIAEIGILGVVHTDYYFPVLFERTVLASPVTISPGESKLVTYTVTMPNL